MNFRYLILIPLAAALLINACGKKDSKAPGTGKDDRQVVMVEELALRPIDEYILVSGKLEGITDITMSSETGGRILQLYKKLGDSVSKGERLGVVDNEVTKMRLDQAEAAVLSAQSAFENAQRNLNYAEESMKRNLISAVEYSSALSAFKGAKAALDGAKAGQEAARNAVNSSYLSAAESGVISNLFVSAGQYINPGTPIATITDARILVLKTGVGETQITRIKKGQPALISYPGISESFKGSVRGFGIRPLPNASTYPLEIEISASGKLLPGMVVSARILSARYQDLLYTPITNILKEFDKNYIFVIDSDNKAIKREVTLGKIIGENVVLAAGVDVGEKIVTTGSENLEDGSVVQIRQ